MGNVLSNSLTLLVKDTRVSLLIVSDISVYLSLQN